jgi:hypothetical protein
LTKISSISGWEQIAIGGGKLRIDVNWGGARLAGSHAGPIQDVNHVLPLGEEKPI